MGGKTPPPRYSKATCAFFLKKIFFSVCCVPGVFRHVGTLRHMLFIIGHMASDQQRQESRQAGRPVPEPMSYPLPDPISRKPCPPCVLLRHNLLVILNNIFCAMYVDCGVYPLPSQDVSSQEQEASSSSFFFFQVFLL